MFGFENEQGGVRLIDSRVSPGNHWQVTSQDVAIAGRSGDLLGIRQETSGAGRVVACRYFGQPRQQAASAESLAIVRASCSASAASMLAVAMAMSLSAQVLSSPHMGSPAEPTGSRWASANPLQRYGALGSSPYLLARRRGGGSLLLTNKARGRASRTQRLLGEDGSSYW